MQDFYTWLTYSGVNLDAPIISVLVERCRPETHMFYLPYNECTITLEEVSLQLDLPVEEEVVTGPVISANWSATCEQLLRNVPDKFKGGRIEMRWLEDNFKTIYVSSSDVEKEKFALTFILRWNNPTGHSGISTKLEDIQLALINKPKRSHIPWSSDAIETHELSSTNDTLFELPKGPITRARAKKFKDAISTLVDRVWGESVAGLLERSWTSNMSKPYILLQAHSVQP
ncbi:hypothetical protein Goshw_022673 [Gossypium schwendimanii]|uniref:Aminotransferase-like plant mobile domain-containing protein n=1 Tax=Gossypium schwendimanii TaxID=34291 RepID=A0A7J9LHP5_GOSSC|nr:hypothetical protein [Gossypium schwendimanii]